MFGLSLGQVQMLAFVMVDASGQEVAGLGDTFTVQVSKAGGAFAAGQGEKGEIGSGWYWYKLTASETGTVGPLSVKVTGAGAVQQNLVYVVASAAVAGVEYTYTLTDAVTGDPITGAAVWFTTDPGGANVVWVGTTDGFGVARDQYGSLPRLDPGTYYVWRQRAGYAFDNPDTEIVS